ncbi:HAD hydrolase-like protein [Clostridium sp. DL1XJH146]
MITSKGIFKKQQLLNKYIKKNKLQHDEVIYIGDEISDIISCKASGVKSIAVTWGYDSVELIKSEKPDFIAFEPCDILRIVEELA